MLVGQGAADYIRVGNIEIKGHLVTVDAFQRIRVCGADAPLLSLLGMYCHIGQPHLLELGIMKSVSPVKAASSEIQP